MVSQLKTVGRPRSLQWWISSPFGFSHNLPEPSPSRRPLFASLALFHFVVKISIPGGSRPRPLATSYASVVLETKIKLGNSGNLEATGVPTAVPVRVAYELLQGLQKSSSLDMPLELLIFLTCTKLDQGSLSGKRLMIAVTDLLASITGGYAAWTQCPSHRVVGVFMERRSGHLGSANKELGSSAVLLERIQFTPIGKKLSLVQQIVQSSRLIT